MSKKPVAFMSYVRFDDKHEKERLTEFRNRLSGEVKMHTGDEFHIFQDRDDIQWGQSWKERIEESIDEVAFLIPIITPSFFKSEHCREELERFIEREEELNRNDLILPVYYVSTPLLDDETKRKTDRLAQVIASRQLADWRELRFEPFTSPQVGKMLEKLAVQIRDALERVQEPEKIVAPKPAPRKRKPIEPLIQQEVLESVPVSGERISSAKTEPPTRVVDQMHRGDHATITEAIKAAKPGDRILIRPGLYKEGIVIDKPLEIIGDGNLSDIVVEAEGKSALLFKATMGRVVNLTLEQTGGGDYFGVDIAQGRLELEGCDITSQSLSCVAIHGGADPRLRRNRIHDGKESGVYVFESGQGTLEDNDIFGNGLSGVEIKSGSNPIVRRNRIHDGKGSGVFVYENGQGTLEDNDIFGNGLSGVIIKIGSNPIVRRNRIHDCKQSGVYVYENGQGTLEDNDIFGNSYSGLDIKSGSNPIVRRNRINKNVYNAVVVRDDGGGTIEDNDLRDNANGAWYVSADSEPKLKRARNLE